MVHTTANAEWSNLALSGLLVEMLRRIVAISEGVAETGELARLEAEGIIEGYTVRVDHRRITLRPRSVEGLQSRGVAGIGDAGEQGFRTPLAALGVATDNLKKVY